MTSALVHSERKHITSEPLLRRIEAREELWCESRVNEPFDLIGAMLRDELFRDTTKRLDLSYVGRAVDAWWRRRCKHEASQFSEIYQLIESELKAEDLRLIRSVGNKEDRIAALFMDYVFGIPDRQLGLLVHEALARLAGIVDIPYPYEEHKELSPKNVGSEASDWGRGLGIIRPHSDDLYEDREVNTMSLTVCRDVSRTPTWFWLLKDVVNCLSDEELGKLSLAEAKYASGRNVNGCRIIARKPVLRRDPVEGLGLRIDFRIDEMNGPRMQLCDQTLQPLFERMRDNLRKLKPLASNPLTGSSAILSNFKILHGRAQLNQKMLFDGESSRILFRSKGFK